MHVLTGWPWTSRVAAMSGVASACAGSDPAVCCKKLRKAHNDESNQPWLLTSVAEHPNCVPVRRSVQLAHMAWSSTGSESQESVSGIPCQWPSCFGASGQNALWCPLPGSSCVQGGTESCARK